MGFILVAWVKDSWNLYTLEVYVFICYTFYYRPGENFIAARGSLFWLLNSRPACPCIYINNSLYILGGVK